MTALYRDDGDDGPHVRRRPQVFYVPDIDGSLFRTRRTDILAGACRGTVVMPVAGRPG